MYIVYNMNDNPLVKEEELKYQEGPQPGAPQQNVAAPQQIVAETQQVAPPKLSFWCRTLGIGCPKTAVGGGSRRKHKKTKRSKKHSRKTHKKHSHKKRTNRKHKQ